MSAFTTVTVKISKTKTKRPAVRKISAKAEVKFHNIRTAYGHYLKRLKTIPSGSGRDTVPIAREFQNLEWLKEPSSETLLRLVELVLTLNCFSFAGNYYKQINGVAMGTRMGPSYTDFL